MSFAKKILIFSLKAILYLIDKNHRKNYNIGYNNIKKFTHVEEISFDSDYGKTSKAMRTVPYQLWEIKTINHSLIGADRHRIINDKGLSIWLEDTKVGDKIKTKSGIEEIISVRDLKIKTHLFCTEVNTIDASDVNNHLYFTNGILSHNTTCAAAYILWFTTFFKDKQVLICANKMNQAQEIMDRIRFSYENMEDTNWIRAGAVEYNKGSITFDNGSSIVSRATTKDAGRGLSISLLYLDEFAFVPPRIAEEFWTAISPVLATGGDCIITSTPNSDEDRFAKIWHQAEQTVDEFNNPIEGGVGVNGFYSLKIPYFEHPERDEKWAVAEKQKIGEQKFLQEHACIDKDTIVSFKIDDVIHEYTVEQMHQFLEEHNAREQN